MMSEPRPSDKSILTHFGETLGLGDQDRANRAMAALGALGLIVSLGVLQLMLPIFSRQPFGPRAQFRFDAVTWSSADYWRSDAPVAGERLAVFGSATAMFSALAILVVTFVIIRQFNWRMALLVVGLGCVIGSVTALNYAVGGPVSGFLILRTVSDAVQHQHLPPDASATLRDQIQFMSKLGFAAAFTTAFAAIAFCFRGGKESLQPPALRARWQSIFTIYVAAMMVVALMAIDTRAIMDYAGAALAAPPDHPTSGDIGDEGAHARLAAVVATFAGVTSGIILMAACFPSFVSVRHDINLRAEEEALKQDAKLSAEDWIKANNLDVTPLKAIVTVFATLAPAALPALSDVFAAIHLPG
jgi:hypothetical protein